MIVFNAQPGLLINLSDLGSRADRFHVQKQRMIPQLPPEQIILS